MNIALKCNVLSLDFDELSIVLLCKTADIKKIWTIPNLRIPSVGHPAFPARILSGFLKIPGWNIQESYKDPARSWKIIQEIQEAKMRKIEIFPRGFEPQTSYTGLPGSLGIQESYQEIQESRILTGKFRNPGFLAGNSRFSRKLNAGYVA